MSSNRELVKQGLLVPQGARLLDSHLNDYKICYYMVRCLWFIIF